MTHLTVEDLGAMLLLCWQKQQDADTPIVERIAAIDCYRQALAEMKRRVDGITQKAQGGNGYE